MNQVIVKDKLRHLRREVKLNPVSLTTSLYFSSLVSRPAPDKQASIMGREPIFKHMILGVSYDPRHLELRRKGKKLMKQNHACEYSVPPVVGSS